MFKSGSAINLAVRQYSVMQLKSNVDHDGVHPLLIALRYILPFPVTKQTQSLNHIFHGFIYYT